MSLRGSTDWFHFDRISGWREISQVKESAWVKARRSGQMRHVSRTDGPNSHLQIFAHTHVHQYCLRHKGLKIRKTECLLSRSCQVVTSSENLGVVRN